MESLLMPASAGQRLETLTCLQSPAPAATWVTLMLSLVSKGALCTPKRRAT